MIYQPFLLATNLDINKATHVVTSILYGANGLVNATYRFHDSEHRKTLEGSLVKIFSKIGLEPEAVTGTGDNQPSEEFKFHWESDIGMGDISQGQPGTFQEVLTKMKNFPKDVKGDDGKGKGVPIKIWITPMKEVFKMHHSTKGNLLTC